MKTLLIMVGVALFVAACSGSSSGGNGGPPPGTGSVATVAVTPADLTLKPGDARQLAATLRDAQGSVLQGRTIAWTSGDVAKVTVTADGMVRALSAGTTTVTAAAEGRSATARIDVVAPTVVVERVALNAISESLEEGSGARLVATAYDAANNVVTGLGVRWTSSDSSTASVEVDGQVTALRAGIVSITATIDGRSAAATIRVVADYAFDLLYGAADVAAPDELHLLDITDPAAVAMPAFPPGRPAAHGAPSPDGSRIAFVVHREWNGSSWQSMIFVADRDGSDSRQLTYRAARNTEPAWSPDGRQIAFTSQVLGEAADVWVMNSDGSDAVNLTANQPDSSKRSPAWSPQLADGSYRIAYSLEQAGSSYLWTMRADGTEKRIITGDPSYFDSEPAWSPDGRSLVFQRTGIATFGDLYLVSSTGGPARALMPGNVLAHGQFGPAWSPDGRLIAFTSKHADGEHYQIWTVWSDGTRLVRRTGETKSHADPAWIMKR